MDMNKLFGILLISLLIFGCLAPAQPTEKPGDTITDPATTATTNSNTQSTTVSQQDVMNKTETTVTNTTSSTNVTTTNGNANQSNNTTQTSTNTTTATASIKEINVTAKQWQFDPATIEVSMGDKVKLNVKSMDVTHGFSIPDFNVNLVLETGKVTTAEFTADKKGEFQFFCTVFCGAGHPGMKGKIAVK